MGEGVWWGGGSVVGAVGSGSVGWGRGGGRVIDTAVYRTLVPAVRRSSCWLRPG